MPDGTISSRADTRRIALATPSGFLAFGLGSGLSPYAPGTMGTIAAMPLAAVLLQLPFWLALSAIVIAFAVGVWLCGVTGRALGVHDHGGIVWDEFVGIWLVLLFVPFEWGWWLASFILFRLFDVLKPWPIRWLDRRVHGGFGVMIDDILAAVYALVPLLIVLHWF